VTIDKNFVDSGKIYFENYIEYIGSGSEASKKQKEKETQEKKKNQNENSPDAISQAKPGQTIMIDGAQSHTLSGIEAVEKDPKNQRNPQMNLRIFKTGL
jgi:hypothetical protein